MTVRIKPEEKSGQMCTSLDYVQLKGREMEWLWNGFLPKGYMTILAAETGIGKSYIALEVMRLLVDGNCKQWPDGSECPTFTNVMLCDTESSQMLWARRAEAAGILKSILIPAEDPFADFQLDDPANFERVRMFCEMEEVPLLVVDSLRGSYYGDENSSDIQNLLKQLADLARDLNIAVLVVHHLGKGGKDSTVTLNRLRGSSAIPAVARVVWAVEQPNPHDERKRLSVLKSNLGIKPDSLGFEITENGVEWCEAPSEYVRVSRVDEAIEIIRRRLENGPMWASVVWNDLDAVGLSKPTVNGAKKKLRVESFQDGSRWKWKLPE